MRRAWRDAMPKGATVKNSKAAVGYNYCNKLFALERKWKNLNNAQREENRRNPSREIGGRILPLGAYCRPCQRKQAGGRGEIRAESGEIPESVSEQRRGGDIQQLC